jgi:hypothetical protein
MCFLRSLTVATSAMLALAVVCAAEPAAVAQRPAGTSQRKPAAAPSRVSGERATQLAPVIVSETTLPRTGIYGNPAWAANSRTSPTTNAYVLEPFEVYAAVIYEGIGRREGRPKNRLTPELEIGLPYRFQLAVESTMANEGRRSQGETTSVELRYALANWRKIPLNPTLFAEWKFGTGREIEKGEEREAGKERGGEAEAKEKGEPEGEGGPEAGEKEGEKGKGREAREERGGGESHRIANSFELRLLLSENLTRNTEWALNLFYEQEVAQEREQEWGFSQSVLYAFDEGRFKAGVEMQFIRKTKKDTRGDAEYSFVIGPSVGVQITRNARLDLAPLLGVTDDSPKLDAFVVFSYSFGGRDQRRPEGPEAPASMRNR